MKIHRRQIIDTNVIVTANRQVNIDYDEMHLYPELIIECITTLRAIMDARAYVVMDNNDEIYAEYLRNLNLGGQKEAGNIFFKWLHDTRYSFPESERVAIEKTPESSYKEFPVGMTELNVDPSDRKFFAVANAHPEHPAIFEATDSKWWNWRETANKCGITIEFLSERYMTDHNR